MADESHGFAQTRARLEEIVAQVRKKDTSLEASLDLLEEGVRLANQCTELIDHADWEAAQGAADTDEEPDQPSSAVSGEADSAAEPADEPGTDADVGAGGPAGAEG